MEQLGYMDWGHRLKSQVEPGRIPVSGTLEVTLRCPLECRMCYNNLPMADAAARERELSTAEYARLMAEMAEAGTLWLLLTGGEIFARPDFLDIHILAKQHGFFITLFTNGTLITPRIADTLAEWPPFRMEITLYGATREVYEAVTGVPGSYDRCLRGIDLLLERNLPLRLKTTVTRQNRHELAAMKQFAKARGVEFKFDALLNPRIDCSSSPLAVRLTPEDAVELDLEDPVRRAGWRDTAARIGEPLPVTVHAEEVYSCGAGVSSFAVDPYGRMSACVISHQDHYDLRRGSFREGWESFLRGVRDARRTRETKCTHCRLKLLCGMCPANGELNHGDKEEPVDFHCHVAHLRAHALGAEVPPHGDCDYCAGGSRYPQVTEEARRLHSRVEQAETRPWVALPVLQAS